MCRIREERAAAGVATARVGPGSIVSEASYSAGAAHMPIPKGQDGDADEFFAKITGYGCNDLCGSRVSPRMQSANLKKRFKGEVVYTYVGDIVVSVNPFCNTGCTGKNIRKKYKGQKNREKLPAHLCTRG